MRPVSDRYTALNTTGTSIRSPRATKHSLRAAYSCLVPRRFDTTFTRPELFKRTLPDPQKEMCPDEAMHEQDAQTHAKGLNSPLLTRLAWRAFRTAITKAANAPQKPTTPSAKPASAIVSTLLLVPPEDEPPLEAVADSPDKEDCNFHRNKQCSLLVGVSETPCV